MCVLCVVMYICTLHVVFSVFLDVILGFYWAFCVYLHVAFECVLGVFLGVNSVFLHVVF